MKKTTIILLICLAILFGTTKHLSAQLDWTKSVSNPLMSPGNDWLSAGFPFINLLEEGDSIHMWFSAATGASVSTGRMGYAGSSDGIVFDILSIPVLEPSLSSNFDSEGVFGASVLFDGSLYRMWYNGYNTQPYYAGKMEAGLATSTDGLNWTRYSENAVLPVGPAGSWDKNWAFQNTVLFEDGIYKMWYTGFDNDYTRIGYATSLDGKLWEKSIFNPVVEPLYFNLPCAQNPRVIHNGDIYQMWFNSSNFTGTEYYIYYTWSVDGISWEADPVLVLSTGDAGSFDEDWVWHPFISYKDGAYRMWYTGFNGTEYSVGYATDFTHVGLPENKLSIENELVISPNPASNRISITSEYNKNSDGILTIVNSLGRKLIEIEVNELPLQIDLSGWDPGLYQARLNFGEKVLCGKFIKVPL
ncbi:MAG: T9SS type A sorting domain-containing protein [Bacteroidales bacterium]|nr:T9SS type A sorting domain-containing protein [Bacteroidales bacterium]